MSSQWEEHKTPGKRASAVKHTGKPVCIIGCLGMLACEQRPVSQARVGRAQT